MLSGFEFRTAFFGLMVAMVSLVWTVVDGILKYGRLTPSYVSYWCN
jgi:hypothetical protein